MPAPLLLAGALLTVSLFGAFFGVPLLLHSVPPTVSWTSIPAEPPVETVRDVLDETVEAIASTFGERIGLWPDHDL